MAEPLPVELEHHIFELTAHLHSKSIPALLLVAHRVKTWITPILYRVVVVDPNPPAGHLSFDFPHFILAIQSQPISEHIKNLFITFDSRVSLTDVVHALASCSAVQNLVLLYCAQLNHLPLLSAMPLHHLSISLKDLFPRTDIAFFHFNLTHLELWDHLEDNATWAQWKGLALIPNPTHLAFLLKRSVAIFKGALAACPRLQVLAYLYEEGSSIGLGDPGIGLEPLVHDTQFVCIRAPNIIADWQIGASGGDDFWVRAERFIAQRNSGEVEWVTFVWRASPYRKHLLTLYNSKYCS
ncbi:hypothetical protein K438DRAFT_2103213 [Mycena galopus ATCC 62051]|nr:hypothetical protein K438DRAFT_2103213 [Mycena galopus ATCC 62051]